MQKTKIQYLTHTWNPISMLCTPVSAGCKNCWHIGISKRFKLNNGEFELKEKELQAPLSLRSPAKIGVQFMGDLFHESVPFEWIDKVMFTIYKSYKHGHTFQILTKRPERMAEYFLGDVDARILKLFRESNKRCNSESRLSSSVNMLPRVWLGTTCENQEMSDERIPELLKCPAAKRFVSIEPMLGPVDLQYSCFNGSDSLHALVGIDWVICGGESGPGARPMHPDWARGVRDQCKAAGVPFFFKQWGEWLPLGQGGSAAGSWMDNSHRSKDGEPMYKVTDGYDNLIGTGINHHFDNLGQTTYRIGKKKAGSLLDGVEHKEYPK